MKKAFVLGLEPFNLSLLKELPCANEVTFLELLSAEEAVEVAPGFRFEELVAHAMERVEKNGPADAIVNYWDFPGACLAPVLSKELGLPGPSLEAVAKCEHKYWARKEMEACIPEMTPGVQLVDPFDRHAARRIELDFPFWLKPIVSHSAYLGFKVDDDDDLKTALSAIRRNIRHFGEPFGEFLRRVDVPAELAGIGGCQCLAEQIISADKQVTLEGYVYKGEVSVLGRIDSVRESQSLSSFARYEYPSRLPEPVLERMKEAVNRFIAHIGYDNGPFNVEFFWDEETDRISVLEINSRISKSHCPLFMLVDGFSHQQVVVDLALGRAPLFRPGGGDWPLAAKFMVRLFQDGEITRVPSATELQHVSSRYPEAQVQVLVQEHQRLSHLAFQDSYSFEIADIFLGGHNDEELREKYADALELLPFEVHLTAPIPSEMA